VSDKQFSVFVGLSLRFSTTFQDLHPSQMANAKFVPVNIAYKSFDPAHEIDESLSPVIFLHGITSSKESWDDVPQVIADGAKRKVYALDARNHGDSDHTDVFNFDLNVDDLFHFMDEMNIPKAVLVGHSMGGLTATNAALRKPERIEMIFSEDMFVKKPTPFVTNLFERFMKLLDNIVQMIVLQCISNELDAMKSAVDRSYSQMSSGAPILVKKEEMYKMNYTFKPNPSGGYDVKYNKDTLIRALSNIETLMSDPCGQYSGPAYFLYGELSPFQVGKKKDSIREHFPNSEFREFKGATHFLHGEYSDKFKKTVLQYLKQR